MGNVFPHFEHSAFVLPGPTGLERGVPQGHDTRISFVPGSGSSFAIDTSSFVK
jgi:hypothetical protein